jgi:hypothetical protein
MQRDWRLIDMATLIRTDRNGTKYYEGMIPCSRCGGQGGADKWQFTGYTCYQCGGTGKMQGKYKVYTPEYEAKLEAKRKARAEKYEREHAEEIAKAEAERKAKEDAERRAREEEEKRIMEQKAISQFIGQVGDKVDMDAVLDHRAWFEIPSFRGFGTDTMHIYTFRDPDGNAIIWKTSKGLVFENGERVHLKGTIKEHSEYDGEKQTVLTRCKVEREA